MRSLTDPDVIRWKRRLERVLAEAPEGIGLYGMDGDLHITADERLEAYAQGADLCRASSRGLQADEEAFATVKDPRNVYKDSGGW